MQNKDSKCNEEKTDRDRHAESEATAGIQTDYGGEPCTRRGLQVLEMYNFMLNRRRRSATLLHFQQEDISRIRIPFSRAARLFSGLQGVNSFASHFEPYLPPHSNPVNIS